MKSMHYFLLALFVLEASVVLQWQVSAQTTTSATITDETTIQAAEQSESASNKKGPKIRRTIRVKENLPEAAGPAAPQQGTSILNEGAQNNVDLKPNISISVPQPIGQEASSQLAREASPTTTTTTTTTTTAKPAVGEKKSDDKPAPPCPHHRHHHHPPPPPPPPPHRSLDSNSPRIEARDNSPLVSITINGQENGISKEVKQVEQEPARVSIVQPVLVRSDGPSLGSEKVPNKNKELFKSYFGQNLAKAANDTTVSVLPMTEFGTKQLVSPFQSSPIIVQMPVPVQMPIMEQTAMFGMAQQPMGPWAFQSPYPMMYPIMMSPMWPPMHGPPGPFPGWRRERRHKKEKKDKRKKKDKEEEEGEEKGEATTTPAPLTTTTTLPAPVAAAVEPARTWLPRILPIPVGSATTTTTTTPKPADDVEWEMVRVPKIKKRTPKKI